MWLLTLFFVSLKDSSKKQEFEVLQLKLSRISIHTQFNKLISLFDLLKKHLIGWCFLLHMCANNKYTVWFQINPFL